MSSSNSKPKPLVLVKFNKMKKTTLSLFLIIVIFISITLVSYSFIQKREVEIRLDKSQSISNELQEEILRLQEAAVDAQARAQEAELESYRLTKQLEDCLK